MEPFLSLRIGIIRASHPSQKRRKGGPPAPLKGDGALAWGGGGSKWGGSSHTKFRSGARFHLVAGVTIRF